MRTLFAILVFFPLIALGNETNKDDTLAQYQKLCSSSKEPEMRQLYCKLANDVIKAKKISEGFSINKKSNG